jgi:hypothetical protein
MIHQTPILSAYLGLLVEKIDVFIQLFDQHQVPFQCSYLSTRFEYALEGFMQRENNDQSFSVQQFVNAFTNLAENGLVCRGI